MDKEFEKKVRTRKIRAAVVAVLIIAAVLYLIFDMKVEKADYGDSLKTQIGEAFQLYEKQKDNQGNEEGQYAPYTLQLFAQQIEAAEKVSDKKDSVYNEEKEAYETLKEQTKAFKKAENRDVVSKKDAQKLIDDKEVLKEEVGFKGDLKLSYAIDGTKLKKAAAMNLTAREEGPYHDRISEILEELSLQGQIVSFYQEGSFGGRIKVTAPMYSEKKMKAYAYKIDTEKGSLKYVSDALLDTKAQTAAFSVSEGGDYVVLTKKLHKDSGKKAVDIKKAEKEAQDQKDKNSGSENTGSDETSGSGSSGNQPSDKPEKAKFDVTIEIRCDTLAEDLSKLEDPALEAYVPADGTILPTTKVTVEEGTTVFDVLNRVCRDKNIQVKSEYTPMYGSYYVQGINYLFEFDGGQGSGWMYKVNGKFPNYGCSSYKLKPGDSVVWCYTCNYGEDVGGGGAV